MPWYWMLHNFPSDLSYLLKPNCLWNSAANWYIYNIYMYIYIYITSAPRGHWIIFEAFLLDESYFISIVIKCFHKRRLLSNVRIPNYVATYYGFLGFLCDFATNWLPILLGITGLPLGQSHDWPSWLNAPESIQNTKQINRMESLKYWCKRYMTKHNYTVCSYHWTYRITIAFIFITVTS